MELSIVYSVKVIAAGQETTSLAAWLSPARNAFLETFYFLCLLQVVIRFFDKGLEFIEKF
jgi:hypothetical protein